MFRVRELVLTTPPPSTTATTPTTTIQDGFTETRCVLEPAGALGIAGAKKWVASSNVRDMTYVCIASGANMDFDRLRFVSER